MALSLANLHSNDNAMIKNYFKIAFRNLLKNKTYSIVNILGLTVGISLFLLIGLFLSNEYSTDKFISKQDLKYRLILKERSGNGSERLMGLTGQNMTTYINDNSPEIESATMIRPTGLWQMEYENNSYGNQKVMLADSNFLDLLDYKLILGNREKALSFPNSAIISESLAETIFKNENPLGKTLQITGGTNVNLKITGVIQEENSHIKFDIIIPWHTKTKDGEKLGDSYKWSLYTYIQVQNGVTKAQMNEKLAQFKKALFGEDADIYDTYVQPLSEIYLESGDIQFTGAFKSGDKSSLWTVAIISIFILLIACINYINISTARATTRVKEVGLRKSIGAHNRQLFFQFISESFVFTFIAFLIAILSVELLLPLFNQLTGSQTSWNGFSTWELTGIICLLFIVVALLSGIYPSYIISSYSAIDSFSLKGGSRKGKSFLRSSLLVFQFVISIFLISSTLFIWQQYKFVQNTDLGFNKTEVLSIDISAKGFDNSYQSFRNEVLQHPAIHEASISTDIIGEGYTNNSGEVKRLDKEDLSVTTTLFYTDYFFANTYQLEIIQGRNFDPGMSTDSSATLINETMAQNLFPNENPIGNEVQFYGSKFKIIGIVKDFHYQTLHTKITPAMIGISKRNRWYLSARFETDRLTEVTQHINKTYEKFEKEVTPEIAFTDEKLRKFYASEEKFLNLIIIGSFLSIFIACLGIYGLTVFTLLQKRSELGIRKVFGASTKHLLLLVNHKISKLILVGAIIAIPLIHFSVTEWLTRFSYKIDYQLSPYLYAIGCVLLIVIATVSILSYKTATTPPVKAIRDSNQ